MHFKNGLLAYDHEKLIHTRKRKKLSIGLFVRTGHKKQTNHFNQTCLRDIKISFILFPQILRGSFIAHTKPLAAWFQTIPAINNARVFTLGTLSCEFYLLATAHLYTLKQD